MLSARVSTDFFLLQRIRPVQGIALGGDEAGVRDDAAKLGFVGAVADAGGINYVFFDQDAADIIRAELQTHLANLDSRREPARLDVVDVVEIEPTDGKCFQIIESGGFCASRFFPCGLAPDNTVFAPRAHHQLSS